MKILFRCDADITTGLGHIMRCLALAQFVKDEGGEAVFACAAFPEKIEKRIRDENLGFIKLDAEKGSSGDAEKAVLSANSEAADWIVVDGYHFTTEYQNCLRSSGIKVLCIDDMSQMEFISDLVLNQNPGFEEKDYRKAPSTRLLLGLKYFLLRREFRKADRSKHRVAGVKKVLVTMGGTDPGNISGKVIESLSVPELKKITVLLSSMNPNIDKIEALLSSSDVPIEMVIDPKNTVPYMQEADLAIHAAGVTSWELAYLGVPGLNIVLADNQEPNSKEMARSGSSLSLGRADNIASEAIKDAVKSLLKDNARLRQMSQAGRQLIDGLGAERVFLAMSGDAPLVSVRKTAAGDLDDYFKWRNSPEVYRYFFTPESVPMEEHRKWFEKKLTDKSSFLYTAYASDEKMGSVRFEDSGAGYKISVMLDPAFHGKGLGTKAIKKGVEAFVLERSKEKDIIAEIKEENSASIKAFTKAGFEKAEKSDRLYCIKMVYKGR